MHLRTRSLVVLGNDNSFAALEEELLADSSTVEPVGDAETASSVADEFNDEESERGGRRRRRKKVTKSNTSATPASQSRVEPNLLQCGFPGCKWEGSSNEQSVRNHINNHVSAKQLDDLEEEERNDFCAACETNLHLHRCPGSCRLFYKITNPKKGVAKFRTHAKCDSFASQASVQKLAKDKQKADEELEEVEDDANFVDWDGHPIQPDDHLEKDGPMEHWRLEHDKKNKVDKAFAVTFLAKLHETAVLFRSAEKREKRGEQNEARIKSEEAQLLFLELEKLCPPRNEKRKAAWCMGLPGFEPVDQQDQRADEEEEPNLMDCVSTKADLLRMEAYALSSGDKEKALMLASSSKGIWNIITEGVKDDLTNKFPDFSLPQINEDIQEVLDKEFKLPDQEVVKAVIKNSKVNVAPGLNGQDVRLFKTLLSVGEEVALKDIYTVISVIANGKINNPDLLDSLMASRCAPLVKDIEAEKARPVLLPNIWMKLADKVLMRFENAGGEMVSKVVQDVCGPTQMGSGRSCEGEAIVHASKIIMERFKEQGADPTILALDIQNAFNVISPQDALDLVVKELPHYTRFTAMRLSRHRRVVVPSKKGVSTILFSKGGLEQGSVCASAIFDLIFSKLVNRVMVNYKDLRDLMQHDGLFIIGKIDRVIAFKTELESVLLENGMKLARGKQLAYCEAGFSPQSEEVMKEADITSQVGGMVVGGAPIGSREFTEGILEKKMQEVFADIDLLVTAAKAARVTPGAKNLSKFTLFSIMRTCVLQRFTYLLRTTDPRITSPYAEKLQAKLDEAIFISLEWDDKCPKGSDNRRTVEEALKREFELGGGGIQNLARQPHACYLASLVQSSYLLNQVGVAKEYIEEKCGTSAEEFARMCERADEDSTFGLFNTCMNFIKEQAPKMHGEVLKMGFPLEGPAQKLQQNIMAEDARMQWHRHVDSLPKGERYVSLGSKRPRVRIGRDDLFYRTKSISQAHKGVVKYLQVHPQVDITYNVLNDDDFAMRFYLLCGGFWITEPIKCACGGIIDRQMLHASLCRHSRGLVCERHSALKAALAAALKLINPNIICSNEPNLATHGFQIREGESENTRADLMTTSMATGKALLIDLTVVSIASTKAIGRTPYPGAAADLAEACKDAVYDKRVMSRKLEGGNGASIVAFGIESTGAWGKEATKLLKFFASEAQHEQLGPYSVLVSSLQQILSARLQKSEAVMVRSVCVENNITLGVRNAPNGTCFTGPVEVVPLNSKVHQMDEIALCMPCESKKHKDFIRPTEEEVEAMAEEMREEQKRRKIDAKKKAVSANKKGGGKRAVDLQQGQHAHRGRDADENSYNSACSSPSNETSGSASKYSGSDISDTTNSGSSDEDLTTETESSGSPEEDADDSDRSRSSESDDSADGDYGHGGSGSTRGNSNDPNSANTLDDSGEGSGNEENTGQSSGSAGGSGEETLSLKFGLNFSPQGLQGPKSAYLQEPRASTIKDLTSGAVRGATRVRAELPWGVELAGREQVVTPNVLLTSSTKPFSTLEAKRDALTGDATSAFLQSMSDAQVVEEEEKENSRYHKAAHTQRSASSDPSRRLKKGGLENGSNVVMKSTLHRHVTMPHDEGKRTNGPPLLAKHSSAPNPDHQLATKTIPRTFNTSNVASGERNASAARWESFQQWQAARSTQRFSLVHQRAVHFSTSLSSHSVKSRSNSLWPRNQANQTVVAQGQTQDLALSLQKSKKQHAERMQLTHNRHIDSRCRVRENSLSTYTD
jgi:hypothetical protein